MAHSQTAPIEDPFLDAGMRGFISNTARKNHWRVHTLMDLEDLIQEGYAIYYKCHKRYIESRTDLTGTKDERRWFQALVKTSFTRYLHSQSVKQTKQSAHTANLDVIPELPVKEFGPLLVLLRQAPGEIMQLMQALLNDTSGFATKPGKRFAVRETTNEYYCRLVGLSPEERDLVEEVRDYFSDEYDA